MYVRQTFINNQAVKPGFSGDILWGHPLYNIFYVQESSCHYLVQDSSEVVCE